MLLHFDTKIQISLFPCNYMYILYLCMSGGLNHVGDGAIPRVFDTGEVRCLLSPPPHVLGPNFRKCCGVIL